MTMATNYYYDYDYDNGGRFDWAGRSAAGRSVGGRGGDKRRGAAEEVTTTMAMAMTDGNDAIRHPAIRQSDGG